MIESIGRYRILDRIGGGEMGELFRARDTHLGRTVALRVVSPSIVDDADKRERFFRDARSGAAVSHPHIAAIYEVDDQHSTPYLACEYVAGQPLKAVIGGRPIATRRAIDFGIQIADAIADAHGRDVVHGDLTVSTVMVTEKGQTKVLDLGLSAWTSSGAARPDTAVDQQADIQGLGVLLFEMLTGRRPSGVRTLSVVNPNLPKELDAIVLRALVKGQPNKYVSAATLSAELRGVAAILDVRHEKEQPADMAEFGSKRTQSRAWIWVLLAISAIVGVIWLATRAT
jgi:serine/threonine-protein kinase